MQLACPEPKKVLVADDDAWLRPLLAELLADEGYAVLEADSGPEALRCIREQHPDLVVLDVALPRRSGLAGLDELAAEGRTRRLPVGLVSGCVDLDQTGQAHPAVAGFHKPLDLAALLSRVAQTVPLAA